MFNYQKTHTFRPNFPKVIVPYPEILIFPRPDSAYLEGWSSLKITFSASDKDYFFNNKISNKT
jgi:hypothetical protein